MSSNYLAFGCPTSRKGAKLVGAIQMTFGAAALLFMIHFGITGHLFNEKVPEAMNETWMFWIPTGGISVCSMVLAFLLFDGVYHKSVIKLRIWIGIMMVSTMLLTVTFPLAMEMEFVPYQLIGLTTLGILLVFYMVVVVLRYYKVLKDELANVHQKLPKLNNASDPPNEDTNAVNVSAETTTTTETAEIGDRNIVISFERGVDESEPCSRIFTVST